MSSSFLKRKELRKQRNRKAVPLISALLALVVYFALRSKSAVIDKFPSQSTTKGRALSVDDDTDWTAVSSAFGACKELPQEMLTHDLRTVRQWRSRKKRVPESITIVTQFSSNRFDKVERQCFSWPDPVSAVVAITTINGVIFSEQDALLNGSSIDSAIRRVDEFHKRMEAEAKCILDIELAVEEFPDLNRAAQLYPINTARNHAIKQASTEIVLLLDVDFLLSPAWVSSYKTKEGYLDLVRRVREPGAIVLPAFHTADKGEKGIEVAVTNVRKGKAAAVKAYADGDLTRFYQAQFDRGHGPTNYSRWVSSVDTEPYQIYPGEGFEPYVLVSKLFMPWYDERFDGYYRNKVVYIRHILGLNFTFYVHPYAFSVHVPHPESETKKFSDKDGHLWRMKALYFEVDKDINETRFKPMMQNCENPS